MKLTELDPEWLFGASEGGWRRGGDFAMAQGVKFLCPVCFVKNGGPVGTHSIICWFADLDVPPEVTPGIPRWPATGTDFDDLALNPSVDAGCWHGFIQNGEIK